MTKINAYAPRMSQAQNNLFWFVLGVFTGMVAFVGLIIVIHQLT